MTRKIEIGTNQKLEDTIAKERDFPPDWREQRALIGKMFMWLNFGPGKRHAAGSGKIEGTKKHGHHTR
ncbi:MAG: hypothetical protein Q7S14_00190 [bacterium]|nr:hypothetical protein [bacterium]